MDGSGAVLCRADEGGLVLSRGAGIVLAEHQKASGVVGLVLDAGSEDVEPVMLCGGFSGNGAGIGLFGRQAGGFGIAGDGQAGYAGQMAV